MTTDTKNSLQCQNLALTRNGVELFAGLDVSLDAGDLLIVQGANGSGKSSLLMALAGLLPIAHGAVLLNGEPMEKHPA